MKHKLLTIRLPIETDMDKLRKRLKKVAKQNKESSANKMISNYIINLK